MIVSLKCNPNPNNLAAKVNQNQIANKDIRQILCFSKMIHITKSSLIFIFSCSAHYNKNKISPIPFLISKIIFAVINTPFKYKNIIKCTAHWNNNYFAHK